MKDLFYSRITLSNTIYFTLGELKISWQDTDSFDRPQDDSRPCCYHVESRNLVLLRDFWRAWERDWLLTTPSRVSHRVMSFDQPGCRKTSQKVRRHILPSTLCFDDQKTQRHSSIGRYKCRHCHTKFQPCLSSSLHRSCYGDLSWSQKLTKHQQVRIISTHFTSRLKWRILNERADRLRMSGPASVKNGDVQISVGVATDDACWDFVSWSDVETCRQHWYHKPNVTNTQF